MIQTIKNHVYAFGQYPINTVIGGLASEIPTKNALATKLGISINIIRRFEIDGSDVKAHISNFYSIYLEVFRQNVNITSFLDLDGKCRHLDSHSFNGCTSLQIIQIPGVTAITGTMLNSCTSLTKVIGDKITLVSTSGIRSVPLLTENNINLSNVHTIHDLAMSSMGAGMKNLYFPKLTTLGSQAFRGNPQLLTFSAPILEVINESTSLFNGDSGLGFINMPKLKVFGVPSVNSLEFLSLKIGCEIRVHIALATANSGAPVTSLLYAKNNRAAIVKFYDDNGNYVSTL